jgi:hypothetical protein
MPNFVTISQAIACLISDHLTRIRIPPSNVGRIFQIRPRAAVAPASAGRGRDEDFSSPPAQIPACAANAPGSSLGSDVVR